MFYSYYIRRATLINVGHILLSFILPPPPFPLGCYLLTWHPQLVGLAGSANSTGDDQKKLDVIGNDIFVNAMRGCGKVKVLVSEELDEALVFPGNGKYIVVCDPIDGSSNLDAGVSVGTIFGIFKLDDNAVGIAEDALKPGTELVAAGFTMYGASANLVLTMKGGEVNGFTLDNALGEFILSHPNVGIIFFLPSFQKANSLYR